MAPEARSRTTTAQERGCAIEDDHDGCYFDFGCGASTVRATKQMGIIILVFCNFCILLAFRLFAKIKHDKVKGMLLHFVTYAGILLTMSIVIDKQKISKVKYKRFCCNFYCF